MLSEEEKVATEQKKVMVESRENKPTTGCRRDRKNYRYTYLENLTEKKDITFPS